MSRPPGDAEFTEFVDARWASLYRTAYLLVGEHAAAEDLVQTALSKAYVSWGRVRSADSPDAYVRTMLVNTATSWFRRRSWSERPTDVIPEATHEPDIGAAERAWLTAELAKLPQGQRTVVVLRFYEDLSVTETAALMGCGEGSVKRQTHLALNKLRQALGPEMVPFSEKGSR